MTRRFLLFTAPFLALCEQSPVYDVLERVSSALSEGDLAVFRTCFDPSMPQYERVMADAKGLMEQNNVSSTIEVLSESEGAAEIDWTLTMKARAVADISTERRKNVKIRWQPYRKSARITLLEPVDWFVPPVFK